MVRKPVSSRPSPPIDEASGAVAGAESADHAGRRASRSARWWLLLLAGLLLLPGCEGCRPDPNAQKREEDEKKQKNKKKLKDEKPFEVAGLSTIPDDPEDTQNHVKPGHWATFTQEIRANKFDYRAELELAAVDKDGEPFDIDRTPYQIVSSRPVALVKGQARTVEMTSYIPTAVRFDEAGGKKKVWFQTRLMADRGGSPVIPATKEATSEMKDYECFLVVLARDNRSYLFLKSLDLARLPSNDFDSGVVNHCRVLAPRIDERVPLPENALTWTGISCIVWDEVNPKLLSADQQAALLDWLHWGGQLVISGPDSLDLIKGTFLEPYLAAAAEETIELNAEAFAPLNDFWSLPDRSGDARRLNFQGGRPVLGVRWRKHEEAREVTGCGGLVVERRVGAGRIVQTAFPLDDGHLLQWKSYDGFMSGALLRRPARDFSPLANLDNINAKPLWQLPADPYSASGESRETTPVTVTHPLFTSNLRYFSRDVGYRSAAVETDVRRQLDESLTAPPPATAFGATPAAPVAPNLRASTSESAAEIKTPTGVNDWRLAGFSASNVSGVAGWNDFSGAAHEIRLAMQEAAGIKIPSGAFVLRMIAAYLVVLVPLNWLVFRLLGKVEWAWIATPVIAVVGAAVVIQQAQLDIGFLRSRREIAILETQGDHPRGHLSRYSLLYAYLGTGYDAVLSDPRALAQPFAKDPTYVRKPYESAREVAFRRDSELRLRNFFVPSYSSEMVHIEQMLDLGGSLSLKGEDPEDWEIVNQTGASLQGVGVLHCPPGAAPGTLQIAWVGELRAGVTRPLRFRDGGAQSREGPVFDEWSESPVTRDSKVNLEREIRLTGLLELATRKLVLFPGDVRLVGWTGEELPGVEFNPTATQTTARTVVVSHLKRGSLPAVERDKNVRTDFKKPAPIDEPAANPATAGRSSDGADSGDSTTAPGGR